MTKIVIIKRLLFFSQASCVHVVIMCNTNRQLRVFWVCS